MSDAKEKAALFSIAASIIITLGKGGAGFATGSLALLSDAAHSLLDVAATTMTWLAIRAANKPADEEHHYGHGKIESIAALVETAFLFLLSGAVAIEGVRRLYSAQSDIIVHWSAIIVLLLSITIDAWRWLTLRRIAKQTNSEALAADALHFSSDLINSILVLAAFGAAQLGFPQADSIVALGVALFIGLAGYQLARRTLDTLLDAAPIGSAALIRRIVQDISGVVTVEDLRARRAGADMFVEIEIGVGRTTSVERLTIIKQAVIDAIQSEYGFAIVTVTAKPLVLDEETILERVLLISARRRLPIHHVIVQDLGGRLSVSLDLEVNATQSLAEAHATATELEVEIRKELGQETEVETHIEPMVSDKIVGTDADEARHNSISSALENYARQNGLISDVHNVRVRTTQHGLIVNYHCRVAPSLSVAEVHRAVDAIEHLVRQDVPGIHRIVSHTEPLRVEYRKTS
jgi:cation diffusion facilitator family transporter